MGSSNSTSVSPNKHAGLTSTSIFVQGLFLQYLHKAVVTILCLCHLYKIYLRLYTYYCLYMSLHGDILSHLYKGISTHIHLLSSILTSLRCDVLQPSLCVSLQNKFLQLSLLVPLRSGIIQSSLLTSLLRFLWNTIL